MTVPLFEIRGLRARPAEGSDEETPEILQGIDLTVHLGEIHAILGADGSGTSMLADTLLASPEYEVTDGEIVLHGDEITAWPTDVRAKAGMFLAVQDPEEIAGVSVVQFLHQAASARSGIDMSVVEFRRTMLEWMHRLEIDPGLIDRHLNEGCSLAERRRNEILQMAILRPDLAILDETDSGLDIDARRTLARGIREVRADRPDLGIVLITDDRRLLDDVQPDHVHVLVAGRIVASGGMELAARHGSNGDEAAWS